MVGNIDPLDWEEGMKEQIEAHFVGDLLGSSFCLPFI